MNSLAYKLGPALEDKITIIGKNSCNPVLTLENFVYEESMQCPVCEKGIITMPPSLDKHTLPLEGLYCVMCGQRYEVESVNHIRKRRRWK